MSTRKNHTPLRVVETVPEEAIPEHLVEQDIEQEAVRHGEYLEPVDEVQEKVEVRYPQIDVLLPESIRTQVAVISRVKRALRNHQVPRDECDVFEAAAFDGDMDHTMGVVESWVSVYTS